MGWLYGWDTRKELIDHLVSGNGVTTHKHCCVGNDMWAVQEGTKSDGTTVKFIELYLLRGMDTYSKRTGEYRQNGGWGYKDMGETCGPNAISCPLAYLSAVPDPRVGYSTEWRERVMARAAKARQKFSVGDKVRLYRREYTITEVLPRGKYRLDGIYTSTPKHTKSMEVIA